jgi:Mg2+/Co2+ transporter CorB
MTARKKIKIISPDSLIGPVLVDELHKNGQTYALVQSSAKGEIEGFIDYTKLDLQRSGKIKDFMERRIYYIHQDDLLSEALKAFKITNHPILVVVNSHEDYVGILNVDNILAELLGHIPGDEFDQYSDLSAVANKHLKIHRAEDEDSSVKTD